MLKGQTAKWPAAQPGKAENQKTVSSPTNIALLSRRAMAITEFQLMVTLLQNSFSLLLLTPYEAKCKREYRNTDQDTRDLVTYRLIFFGEKSPTQETDDPRVPAPRIHTQAALQTKREQACPGPQTKYHLLTYTPAPQMRLGGSLTTIPLLV